jgi:hypothetical protein
MRQLILSIVAFEACRWQQQVRKACGCSQWTAAVLLGLWFPVAASGQEIISEDTDTQAVVSEQSSGESRQEEWLSERRERLANNEGAKPSKLVEILSTVENRGFEQFISFQLEHLRVGFGKISPVSNFTPAIQYERPRLAKTPLKLRAAAAYSITGFQFYGLKLGSFRDTAPYDFLGEGFVGAPFNFDRRSQEPTDRFFYADLRYRDFPREYFFGIGPDSSKENRSDYGLRETAFELIGGYQFTRWMAAEIRGGYLTTTVGRANDGKVRDSQEVFAEASAPGLGGEQSDYWRIDWALYLAWEGDPNVPAAQLGLRFARFDEVDEGRFDFSRFSLDARGQVPLGSRQRSLAVRFYTSGDVVDINTPNATVPFYLMKTLGGNETLRGYQDFRFRGKNLLYMSAEYRWEATAAFELALFYDAGKVYEDRHDFGFGDLKSTWGFGIRAKSFRRVTFRIDIGRSPEGTLVFFAFGPSF